MTSCHSTPTCSTRPRRQHASPTTRTPRRSDGVDSSMRVLGEEAVVFEGSGSGFLFPSQLWHRTERAQAGVWKLAIFFGYWLPQQR
ncbi:hypothetical protein AB1Y20_010352 [Prymnesium parvum]|uniref:Uncharacterized protein n=1 Tax=Prymnesium parvum TaxID=97485 RepID=A0AB34K6W3_PRYPA